MSTLAMILLAIVMAPLVIWLIKARGQRIVREKARFRRSPAPAALSHDTLVGLEAVVSSDVLTRREGQVSIAMEGQRARTYDAHLNEGEGPLTRGAKVLVIELIDGRILNVVSDELPSLEDHSE
jgi:hypothetical protein